MLALHASEFALGLPLPAPEKFSALAKEVIATVLYLALVVLLFWGALFFLAGWASRSQTRWCPNHGYRLTCDLCTRQAASDYTGITTIHNNETHPGWPV